MKIEKILESERLINQVKGYKLIYGFKETMQVYNLTEKELNKVLEKHTI